MIDAFVGVMETEDGFTGPVNLGNPDEFTIKELAEKTIEMTGSSSEIEYCPLPADDPRQRCPDIDLANNIMGWKPKVKLDQGLKETVQWFSENHC